MSRDTGSTSLAARTATQVQSSIAKPSAAGKRKNSKTASRSIEEIQVVFDRNKSAIYSLYNRALRKDPTLQGKLVLSLTIAPDRGRRSIGWRPEPARSTRLLGRLLDGRRHLAGLAGTEPDLARTVAGNHDVPNAAGRAHTLEIFHTLEIENVYVARSPDVFDIETAHGPVQVGTLPWVVRSRP